jgi:hypothetical protein
MKPATGHRSRPRPNASTRPRDTHRATATWPHRQRPTVYAHTDGARVRRIAQGWAKRGARVVVQRRTRAGEWRTRDELDGPAILAAHAAEQDAQHRARIDAHLDATTTAFVEEVLADHDEQQRAELARLMTQPPAPRTRRARHTAGGGSPR